MGRLERGRGQGTARGFRVWKVRQGDGQGAGEKTDRTVARLKGKWRK